jgi:hypothetical protein
MKYNFKEIRFELILSFCAADNVRWFRITVVPQGHKVVEALVLWLQVELVEIYYYSGIGWADYRDPIINICRISVRKVR